MTGFPRPRPRLFRPLLALAAGALVLTAVPAAEAGPPPWAPAHGYRAKQQPPRVVAVPMAVPTVIPFGIDRGVCDRGLLSGELVGAAIGGVAGGVAGSQFGRGSGRTAATIGGTLVGILIGGAIGQTMDRVDQACVGQALEHAPSARPVAWHNPDSGVDYAVVPQPAYRQDGTYCREYQTTAVIDGRPQQTYGRACRMPDGAWRLAD